MSGPLGKQFAASDLDLFMSDPKSFRLRRKPYRSLPTDRIDMSEVMAVQ